MQRVKMRLPTSNYKYRHQSKFAEQLAFRSLCTGTMTYVMAYVTTVLVIISLLLSNRR